MGVVERIYSAVGLALPGAVRREMERFIAENGRDKRPAHAYSLEQFGFDRDALRRTFSAYSAAFLRPSSSATR
jgi:hypothetical protein